MTIQTQSEGRFHKKKVDDEAYAERDMTPKEKEIMNKSLKYAYLIKIQTHYFTCWVIFLLFFKQSYKYFDMFFLTLFVLVGSTFFFYVRPGFVVIPFFHEVVTLSGFFKTLLIHIAIHILPFLYVLIYKFPDYSKSINTIDFRLLNSMLLFGVYALYVNFQRLYFVDWYDILYSSFIALVFYVLFRSFY